MFDFLVNALAMPMGRVQSFDGVSFHDCSCPQYHHYNDTLRLDNLTITAVSPHLPDLVVSHDPPSTTSSSRRSQNHTFVFHEKSFNKSSSSKNSSIISQVTNTLNNTQTTRTGSHSNQTTIGSSNGSSALTVATRTVATQANKTDTRINSSTFPDTTSRNSRTSRTASRTDIHPVPTNRGGSLSFGVVPPFENEIHDDNNENEKSPETSILDTPDSAQQTQVEFEETESHSIETIDETFVDVSRLSENLNSNLDDSNSSTYDSTSSAVTSNNRRNLSSSSTSSPSTYDEGSTSKFGQDPTVNFCKIDVSVTMDNIKRVQAPQSPAEDEKVMKDVDLRLKQMLAIRERLQTDPTYDSNSTLLDSTSSVLSSDLVPFHSTEHHLHLNRAQSTDLSGDYPLHQNPDDNRDRRDRPNFRLIHEMRKLRLRWELPPPIPPSVTTSTTAFTTSTTTKLTCGCDHGRELLSVTLRGSGFDESRDSEAVASAVMTQMGADLRKIADDFQMTHGMRRSRSWKAMALLEPMWLRQRLASPARQTLAITVTSVLCWRFLAELLSRLR